MLACRYVVDSVAYLQGLVSVGEVVPAAKQYRDRMLARVVVDALQVGERFAASASDCVHVGRCCH